MTRSDFSLMRGGLFSRWEQRYGIGKRVIAFGCVTWIPVLALDLLLGRGDGPRLLTDLGMNVRLLFAGPILILADAGVGRRVSLTIREFEERDLFEDPGRFRSALAKAESRINGRLTAVAEAGLLALVVIAALSGADESGPARDWATRASGAAMSPAAVWYLGFAVPLLQFMQLRWLWRFGVWASFLWDVAKLRLRVLPSHPDLAGGLAFLAPAQESFVLLWISLSAAAASSIPARAQELGRELTHFFPAIGALIAVEAFLTLAPLAFFVPHLARGRRTGLRDYGELSAEYVRDFDRKWIDGPRGGETETLLGTGDIQSLADIGNSFERVQRMRIFPAERSIVTRIFLAALLPFLPLVFMEVPVEQVLRMMLKLLI